MHIILTLPQQPSCSVAGIWSRCRSWHGLHLHTKIPCSKQNQQSVHNYFKNTTTSATKTKHKNRKEFFLKTMHTYKSKTYKRLKERFLIRRNRTKHANFRCNHLFRAKYNRKQINQPSLSVRCQEAGGRKRAKDCLNEKRRRA